MKYVVTEHEYYVLKRMSYKGFDILMKYGPINLGYHLNDQNEPEDNFAKQMDSMDTNYKEDCVYPGDIYVNGIMTGLIICDVSRLIQFENNMKTDSSLIIGVSADDPKEKDSIKHINYVINKKIFEIKHNHHPGSLANSVWSVMRSFNHPVDEWPSLIEKSDYLDGCKIHVRADFVAIQHVMTPISFVRHFIYKIKVSSSDHMSTETKIIEIDEENLKCLKEDPIGYVIYHNIFDVGYVISVNYKL